MKYLKILGLAAVAAMAMAAFAAGSASATVLEVGGEKKDKDQVNITASLKPGTSAVLSRTDGSFANECNESHVTAATDMDGTPPEYSGPTVTGGVSVLSFNSCTRPVTVHAKGKLHVTWTSGTDGTVSSSGAQVTVGSPFGTLNCQTGSGAPLGNLTGTDGSPNEHAELHIQAVINCGFLVPTANWKGTYIVTNPTGLGVLKE